MKTATLTKINSLQSINPALISTSFKTPYRPRFKQEFILNELQKRDYNRLLHGLKAYTVEEVREMEEEDKRSIIYRTNAAWSIVNKLKQERLNNFLGNVLRSVFGRELCGDGVPFLLAPITDSNFQVSQDIKECVVPTVEIAREFVRQRILPSNFLS